ncbi:hypothetical protein M0812_21330 [Anaeramoeba flamelloides]|uniref:Uncharacterized protein n=1 Tax=Anaeramoeba flamelloides TaxID=1746091 RepID=A0AAV7YU08_9EUKA|nr:hypothetical protein M0812_21330 [Anaeramoeba flamelloides]
MSNHRNKKKSKHPRTKKHSTTQKKKNSPQNGSTRGQTGSAIKEKMRTLKHKTSMENLRGGKSKYDNQMRVRLKKSLNKESQRMFKKFSKIIPHKKTSKKKIQNIKTNTKRNKRKEKRNYKSKSTKEQEQEQQQQQQPSKNNLTRKTKILLSENNLFKLGQEEGNHEINGENKTKDRNNNKNNSKNKNKKKNYNEKSVNYKGSKLKKDQTHFVDLQNKNTKNQTKNNSSLLKNSKMELIQSEEQNDYPQNINSPLMDGDLNLSKNPIKKTV